MTALVFCASSALAAAPPSAKWSSSHPVIAEDSTRWKRDPFTGTDAGKGDKIQPGKKLPELQQKMVPQNLPELAITGIMQADNAFHALINGRVVKAGDTVDGVTIMEITRYQVLVQNAKKEKIIYDIYQGRIDRGKK